MQRYKKNLNYANNILRYCAFLADFSKKHSTFLGKYINRKRHESVRVYYAWRQLQLEPR